MQRWTSLLGAMMLVLMVWTGTAAYAAERLDCIPANSEAAGHYDGDGDQWPSKGESGATHHHSGCSGHQVAAPVEAGAAVLTSAGKTVPAAWDAFGLAGRVPDDQLRPPIA